MGIQVNYTATSLEDLALLFDQRARDADRRFEAARKATDRDVATIEARTWHQASEIVRATTLTVENPSN